jgi:lysylphosphatidylglycerol synthetase-like protein (DUF2156 family)
MAPGTSSDPQDPPHWEERAVKLLFRKWPAAFRADSLRRFKAKYADDWEPRYAVYRSVADLPRLGIALRTVTEIRDDSGTAA